MNMKKIIAGLLVATALNSIVHAGDGDHSDKDFRNVPGFGKNVVAFKHSRALMVDNGKNALIGSQTIVQAQEEVAIETPSVYKNALLSGTGYLAGAAGLGLTYLYGPTALFWGTYHASSFLLGKLGITGLTGLSAATKAALMVAESPVAKAMLAATGGTLAQNAPALILKTGEVLATGAGYAAQGAWSLGKSAFNYFSGSSSAQLQPVVKTEAPSREEIRAKMADAAAIRKNLQNPKARKLLGA